VSPVPIIELQRRLTLVGAIRAGGEKPEKGPGRKLEAFRLTSPRQELVVQAAELYGGNVSPWQSPVGREWQVHTEAEEIPVLVMPGYSLRQSYELWEGATKRTRLCDGVDEELSGGPCICNSEGVERCDLYTRLVVALPELDTVLGWRLISRGANAGHELPTMMALIEAKAAGQAFVPARLRLDQRRGVKDGQVVRYVVPTVDLGAGYLALAARDANGPAALPRAGYIPAERRDPSLEQALNAVREAPPPAGSPARRAAPLGPEHADFEAKPLPVEEQGREPRQTMQATGPQRKKLDVQVGQLRDAGHITTEQLWAAIAGLRAVDIAALVDELGGRDEQGQLHWAPLREGLTRPEAVQLIDWLEVKEARVGLGRQPDPVPPAYNEFPEGY
jgi:recombination directionality factor gp3-like protein